MAALTAAAAMFGDAILVPITEVGSLAVGVGWLSACVAYLLRRRGYPAGRVGVAGDGVARLRGQRRDHPDEGGAVGPRQLHAPGVDRVRRVVGASAWCSGCCARDELTIRRNRGDRKDRRENVFLCDLCGLCGSFFVVALRAPAG